MPISQIGNPLRIISRIVPNRNKSYVSISWLIPLNYIVKKKPQRDRPSPIQFEILGVFLNKN